MIALFSNFYNLHQPTHVPLVIYLNQLRHDLTHRNPNINNSDHQHIINPTQNIKIYDPTAQQYVKTS